MPVLFNVKNIEILHEKTELRERVENQAQGHANSSLECLI